MIWVKITATEQELEQFCYKPLVSGGVYEAEKITNSFYDVFYNDEYVMRGVWVGRLIVLGKDECREKLNKLGI